MTPEFACHLGKQAPLRAHEVAIEEWAPAIRIHAAPLVAPEGLWGIALSVGYVLPMSFVAAVASLSRAFVLTLEDHEGRARAALRLCAFGAEAPSLTDSAERLPLLTGLNNVRAALEWCFGASGDTGIGVELAAAAAPVFLAMSLLPECHR